jgi:hypothetical protein
MRLRATNRTAVAVGVSAAVAMTTLQLIKESTGGRLNDLVVFVVAVIFVFIPGRFFVFGTATQLRQERSVSKSFLVGKAALLTRMAFWLVSTILFTFIFYFLIRTFLPAT